MNTYTQCIACGSVDPGIGPAGSPMVKAGQLAIVARILGQS